MPAGGGVAGQPIDSYLVGRKRFVLVDPGDPTGDGLDRAVEEAERRGGTIEAVALTCAEPDHAGGAESIREQLGIMVFGGPYASNHVPYVITELNDGSMIDEGDVPLRLAWTPGLERASSALVVGDGRFVIAGDLDGVRGRRSIFGPVDEEQLRSSVARLRSLAPNARWLGGHPVLDSDS
jgi:glyoxylase-like metal-dependent hydrolase (beta-lactamase superfamily II)